MQRRENRAEYEAVEADSFFRKGCGSYWRLIFFTPFFLSVGGDPTFARDSLTPFVPFLSSLYHLHPSLMWWPRKVQCVGQPTGRWEALCRERGAGVTTTIENVICSGSRLPSDVVSEPLQVCHC
jgi:hypothetical protein